MPVIHRSDFNGAAGALAEGWTAVGSLGLDGAGFATGTGNADHSLSGALDAAFIEFEFGATIGANGELAIAIGPVGSVAFTNPGNPGCKAYLDTFFASGIQLHAADNNVNIASAAGLSSAHVFMMRIAAGSPVVQFYQDAVLVGTCNNSGMVPMDNLGGVDAIRFGCTFDAKVDYIEIRAEGIASQEKWTEFVHSVEVA